MPTSGEPAAAPTRLSDDVLQAHMQQIINNLAESLASLPANISAVELAIVLMGASACLNVVANGCLVDARDGTKRSGLAAIREQLRG